MSGPRSSSYERARRASLRTFGQEIVVRKVCETLKPIARQCVIISFDLAAVHHVRQVSSYRIGWVLSEYSSLSALKCEALAPDYVFCDHELLTENSSKLWRGPWRWAIYEVTTRKLAMDLAARGAKLVETMAVRAMRHGKRLFRVPFRWERIQPELEQPLDPEELEVPDREVTTVRSELGRDVDLLELLRALLSNLDAELGRIEDFGAILEDWRNLNCTLGEKVRVRRFGDNIEGRAVDLSPEGALLLSTRAGTLELFEGEIEHLRQGDDAMGQLYPDTT
jgi:hypothetical protein